MPATNKEGTTILDRYFATPPRIAAHAVLAAETGVYPAALAEVLSPAMTARAREAIQRWPGYAPTPLRRLDRLRSEEHTSELQSLMRISYAVFCLKKKNK